MPTITQTNTLDITVEKFLQACSKTELQEIDVFIQLVKQGFIPTAVFAAMEIIDRICTKSVLDPLDVVNLMRDFDGLENLRKISLVKKPQLINQSEDHEQ